MSSTSHTTKKSEHPILKDLLAGNRRFALGAALHLHQSLDRCQETLSGQHPDAVILTCSDSRLPPEILLDQGIGDLFVIRNAGNIVDDVVIGSIEYAVEHLGVQLVLVLGHTGCGAVTAAVQSSEAEGHIISIVQALQPAVQAVRSEQGDPVLNAAVENVRRMVNVIENDPPILDEAVRHGHLTVVGAIYELDSGLIKLVD